MMLNKIYMKFLFVLAQLEPQVYLIKREAKCSLLICSILSVILYTTLTANTCS